MEKRVVLLTGAAGFIGHKTAQMLLEYGDTVVGIDNMNDYYDVRLKEYRLEELKRHGDFSFFQVDLENRGALEILFQMNRFDCVINLAARAGVRYSIVDPFVYLSTNTFGTLNLLELSKKRGIEKFVLASTSSLYAGQTMPFREDLPANTPLSSYAASKKGAEVMAYTYHYLFGIDVTILRYFTVYGPAGRPDMSIFRFIQWINNDTPLELFGDGEQTRDFTYVDDIAKGTLRASQVKNGYEIINLGNNNPHKLKYAIELIEDNFHKKAKYIHKAFHKADMKATWADIEKAGKILDWSPHVTLETGIEQTVRWHMDNKKWLDEVQL
jgi:nucleoside-diphosphate-sugar epimerase